MAGGKRIGLRQIADAAGVSPSTVSLVLNNHGGESRIAPETQEKVRHIARDLGYMPRGDSGFSGALDYLCVFLPVDIGEGPMRQVFNGFLQSARETGRNSELVAVPFIPGQLSQSAGLLSAGSGIAGAIIMGIGGEDADFLTNCRSRVPIVLFNREIPGFRSVVIDNYEIGREVCGHFLRRGHRRLAVVAPDSTGKAFSLRLTGFRQMYAERTGLEDVQIIRSDGSSRGGHDAARKLSVESDFPTAVFLAADDMVPGFFRGLREAGIRVPQDMEVISFGGKECNEWNDPPVTSFFYPAEDMINDSIQILRAVRSGQTYRAFTQTYPARVEYRESCPLEGRFLP